MHGKNDRESKSGRAPLQVRANANLLSTGLSAGAMGLHFLRLCIVKCKHV
jgi:hypothetical protein